MGDRLRAGIPPWYVTNSALHPSWVAKSSTSLYKLAGVKAGMSPLPGDPIYGT